MFSDDARVFPPIFITVVYGKHMVNICENILDASKNIFMNLTPYVFDVDHVAKIRSELIITVLEEKN